MTAARNILLAAALSILAGCDSGPPPAAAGRDVVRPNLGFALNIPNGWLWRDLNGDVVLEVYRPAAAGEPGGEKPAPSGPAGESHRASAPAAQPVVHVLAINRDNVTLGDWADQAIASAREVTRNLEVVGRKDVQLADGREALELVLRSPHGVQPMVQRMWLAVTGGRAYALVATTPEREKDAADAAFKACFDSFIVW